MKKLFALLLALTLALSLAACGGSGGKPILTREKYDQLQNGMTYEEVVEIIGFEGQLSNETGSTRVYNWDNLSKLDGTVENNAVVTLYFDNGGREANPFVLIDKNQTGLGESKGTSSPTGNGDQNGNDVGGEQPRVTNVNSPMFEQKLTDGFIVPVNKKNTAPDGYIAISTPEEFVKIGLNPAVKYILMSDIDLTTLSEPFSVMKLDGGLLDGNGFKVSHSQNIYLFMNVAQSKISNLALNTSSGGLVNILSGASLENCYVTGTRRYTLENIYNHPYENVRYAGALANQVNASGSGSVDVMINCYNAADFVIEGDTSRDHIGGLAGNLSSNYTNSTMTVKNCFNTGNIKFPETSKGCSVAGIANGDFMILNCYNTGDLVANSVVGIGGKRCDNCYNSGNLQGESVSGIGAYETTAFCYNSGELRGNGIYGIGGKTISNCYNSGAIYGGKAYGIGSGKITNCYSVGKITGDEQGAIGANDSTLEQCYYLDTVVTEATPNGALFATVKKLTADQMKSNVSFDGFDFTKVWIMGQGDYLYPVFQDKFE